MKKVIILAMVSMLCLSACSTETAQSSSTADTTAPSSLSEETTVEETTVEETTVTEAETTVATVDIHSLVVGDEVSIVGQKAADGLVNENTMWVQVQQPGGGFVMYHCQMKDEYLSQAEDIPVLQVAKVKGLFLSMMELEIENTSPLVTLYDCELLG